MKIISVFLLILPNLVWASMELHYQEGSSYISPLQKNAQSTLLQTNPKNIPGFETANPPEASLDKNGNFSTAIQQSLKNNAAGESLIESSKTRQRFTIDPKTDPLFKVQDGKSAEEILNIRDEGELMEEGFVTKMCEEGGEDIVYECLENRQVIPQVPLKTATLFVDHLKFSPRMESYRAQTKKGRWNRHSQWEDRQRQNGWGLSLPKELNAFKEQFCLNFKAKDAKSGATFNIDCSRIKTFQINNARRITEANGLLNIVSAAPMLNITLQHDTYEGEESDEWISDCENFEQMVEQGLCQYGERALSQGAETRNISGYKIYKDAWQYRRQYFCKMIKDECSALRAQGCTQTNSTCKENRQGKCWVYQQSYQCPNGKFAQPIIKAPANEAFCLTGNCHNTSYQANTEMLDVVSRLSLLKQVQDELRSNINQDFRIFKGSDNRCSRNCLSFKDCCGGMKGWGVSIHIAGCKEDEKQLAKMREQDLCYQIGSYCSKKVLGKCTSKKTSFCCFNTKFARLLQEQGRPQLGLGWGTAECPDCRGLTIQELSKIDLSKLDFREVFDEMMQKYKQPDIKSFEDRTTQKIEENLKRIQQGLESNQPVRKSGVLDGNKSNL